MGDSKIQSQNLADANLADAIEQFMFERGEYDYYGGSDRIRWLEGTDEREKAAENIQKSLQTEEGRTALINYLEDEICVMDEEDELLETASRLKDAIAGVERTGLQDEMPPKTEDEERKHCTKVFCDMLDTMDFSLDTCDGDYFLVDRQNDVWDQIILDDILRYFDPRRFNPEQRAVRQSVSSHRNFSDAADITKHLYKCLNYCYFDKLELIARVDFCCKFPRSGVPASTEEWVGLMDSHKGFKETYRHEYEVMKLISSPEALKQINLDDVVRYFNLLYPEKKAVRPRESEEAERC